MAKGAGRTYNPSPQELTSSIEKILATNPDYDNKQVSVALLERNQTWNVPERRVAKFVKRTKSNPSQRRDDESSVAGSVASSAAGSVGSRRNRLFGGASARKSKQAGGATPNTNNDNDDDSVSTKGSLRKFFSNNKKNTPNSDDRSVSSRSSKGSVRRIFGRKSKKVGAPEDSSNSAHDDPVKESGSTPTKDSENESMLPPMPSDSKDEDEILAVDTTHKDSTSIDENETADDVVDTGKEEKEDPVVAASTFASKSVDEPKDADPKTDTGKEEKEDSAAATVEVNNSVEVKAPESENDARKQDDAKQDDAVVVKNNETFKPATDDAKDVATNSETTADSNAGGNDAVMQTETEAKTGGEPSEETEPDASAEEVQPDASTDADQTAYESLIKDQSHDNAAKEETAKGEEAHPTITTIVSDQDFVFEEDPLSPMTGPPPDKGSSFESAASSDHQKEEDSLQAPKEAINVETAAESEANAAETNVKPAQQGDKKDEEDADAETQLKEVDVRASDDQAPAETDAEPAEQGDRKDEEDALPKEATDPETQLKDVDVRASDDQAADSKEALTDVIGEEVETDQKPSLEFKEEVSDDSPIVKDQDADVEPFADPASPKSVEPSTDSKPEEEPESDKSADDDDHLDAGMELFEAMQNDEELLRGGLKLFEDFQEVSNDAPAEETDGEIFQLMVAAIERAEDGSQSDTAPLSPAADIRTYTPETPVSEAVKNMIKEEEPVTLSTFVVTKDATPAFEVDARGEEDMLDSGMKLFETLQNDEELIHGGLKLFDDFQDPATTEPEVKEEEQTRAVAVVAADSGVKDDVLDSIYFDGKESSNQAAVCEGCEGCNIL